ncbi:hypothetical protein SCARD494_05713 [Seiridium cardinale]
MRNLALLKTADHPKQTNDKSFESSVPRQIGLMHAPRPIAPGNPTHCNYEPDIIQRVSNRPALTCDSSEDPYPIGMSSETDTNASVACNDDPSNSLFNEGQLVPTRNAHEQSMASVFSVLSCHPLSSSRWEAIGEPQGVPPKPFSSLDNKDMLSVWLADLRGSFLPSPEQEIKSRIPLRRITSDPVGLERGNSAIDQEMANIAAAELLQTEVALPYCPGPGLSRMEDCAFGSSDISSSAASVDTRSSVSPATHSDSSGFRIQSYFTGWHNSSHKRGAPSRSQSEFRPGYDGPSSSINSQSEHSKAHIELGMINWEKSWFRHKPRRVHNVSEVTAPDPAVHKHAVDLFSMTGFESDESEEDIVASPIDGKQHHHHELRTLACKSCPEFYCPPHDAETGIESGILYRTRQSRHTMRDAVRKRFQYLRSRFHRPSSSYSVRSDFPVPPYGTKRRLLSRDAVDMYTSSGEETGLFTTPVQVTPTTTPGCSANHLEFATPISDCELHTTLAKISSRAPNSGVVTAPSVISSDTLGPLPRSPGSTSNKAAFVAHNTAILRSGRRRRPTTRSRLSEVTTPDDISTPEAPPCSCSPSDSVEHDESAIDDSDKRDSSYRSPRPFSSTARENGSFLQHNRAPSSTIQREHTSLTIAEDLEVITETGFGEELIDTASPIANRVKVETKISPVGQTSDSVVTDAKTTYSASSYRAARKILGIQPRSTHKSRSPPELFPESSQVGSSPVPPKHDSSLDVTASCTQETGTLMISPSGLNNVKEPHEPCHPDTWNESQGEPGNSDPFCPVDCGSKRPSAQPSRSFRKSTSGTVTVLDRVDSGGSEASLDPELGEGLGGCGQGCPLED